MARVKDLWFSEVPVKDAERKTVRDPQGRPVTEKRKTRKHPDNGGSKEAKRWLACWDGTGGKEQTRAFEKKAAAEKYATSMEADALRGIRYADPKRGAITVREYGETKFMPAMLHLRPNSADTYTSHLKNHVYPALGARKMGTITRTDVQSFVTVVSAKLAPSTTETVYAVLRAMMQAAVDDDPQVIPVNPCTRINLPKVTRRVVEPLPAAAVMALHRAISPRYQVAVALGAGLGLREGEAFGLTVPRVDFLRRKVHVLTQAQRGQLGAVLKTDASARTIPADDWVLQQVTSHIQRYGTGVGEVVITNRIGKVARRNAFGDSWRNAVRDARTCGREPAEPREGGKCAEECADPAHCLPKGTRFHDLRREQLHDAGQAGPARPDHRRGRLGRDQCPDSAGPHAGGSPRGAAAGHRERRARQDDGTHLTPRQAAETPAGGDHHGLRQTRHHRPGCLADSDRRDDLRRARPRPPGLVA
jgi:integrase